MPEAVKVIVKTDSKNGIVAPTLNRILRKFSEVSLC